MNEDSRYCESSHSNTYGHFKIFKTFYIYGKCKVVKRAVLSKVYNNEFPKYRGWALKCAPSPIKIIYIYIQGVSKKLNRFEIALNFAKQQFVSGFLYI
jgi:hypothetical protein